MVKRKNKITIRQLLTHSSGIDKDGNTPHWINDDFPEIRKIKEIYNKEKSKIQEKLKEFRNLKEEDYIKEHIFCLLTPQSKAQSCWSAIEQLFLENNFTEENIKRILIKKTRFHNTKTIRILYALENWSRVKENLSIKNKTELRKWLSENVNGYGLKEAGHFLRNIGKSENQIAILDRHILKNLFELNKIPNIKIKSKKDYLEKEKSFIEFSKEIKIPIDELDLLFWSKENGEIFK